MAQFDQPVTLFDRFLKTAKAWAALAGALLTALVGTMTPDDPGYRFLTGGLAVCTALVVYRVRNRHTRSVTVRLNADTTGYVAELERAKAQVDRLQRRLDNLTEPPDGAAG